MPQIVSLQQACANALATYLTSEFVARTALKIDQRWPDAAKQLPEEAITVLLAGAPVETEWEPHVVGQANQSATTAVYTWAVASIVQPMQLDVWTRYDVVRDDLVALLTASLHKGEAHTMGAASSDPVRHGVLLHLASGWTGTVDCIFQQPALSDSADSANVAEFRATYRGEARAVLTVAATSRRMATLKFRQRLTETAHQAGLYDVTNRTTAGVTHTTEP